MVEILNKSCLEPIKIKKCSAIGFVVIEPDFLSFKDETTKGETKKGKDTTKNVELLDKKEKNKEGAF